MSLAPTAGAVWLGLLFCHVPIVLAQADSPPPLEAYGSLPKAEDVVISPDGTMLALVTTAGDQRVLSIQKLGGGIIRNASIGDLKLSGLEWAGNDYIVAYFHQTARLNFSARTEQEFTQGVIVGVADGGVKPLLRQSGDYLPAIFGQYGFAHQDGAWFGYFGVVPTEASREFANTAGRLKQAYPDLYRVNLQTGGVQRVTRGTSEERNWVLDANGQIVVESEYDPASGAWKIFPAGSPDKPIAAGNSPFGFGLMGLGRTPGTVLVRQGGNEGEIVELHLDSGQTEIFLPAGKAAVLFHARATKLLLGAVVVDDSDMLMFDPTLDRHIKSIGKAFKNSAISFGSASDDLTRVVLHVTGAETGGTWQLVDFTSGRADPIVDDYPAVPTGLIGKAAMFNYRAADGLALHGVITLPPDRVPHGLPLVVLPHGGPEACDEVRFDWWAQAFAARGYVVFQPNFRGSSGYGMAFRNAGYGQWGRKMQTDISDGVAALAARGVIDPRRVCIVGASYGGYAALAGVTLQHGLYRCAASYGGLSDLHEMLYSIKANDSGQSRRYADPAMRYWSSYLGISSPDDALLATISPIEHAKEADAPVLLIYGEKDTVVPTEQSKDMASALKRAGKPVEVVELDAEDHWLSRSATRLQMLKAMVAFVEKYNPPGEAGASSPTAQAQSLASPGAAPPESACTMHFRADAPPPTLATVTDTIPVADAQQMIRLTEASTGGMITPDYVSNMRVRVRIESDPTRSTVALVPDGLHVASGDRIEFVAAHANPALPCHYIPNLITRIVPAAAKAH